MHHTTIDRIYNSYSSIGDLSGLEICELLSSLTITGSGYLEDITPLSGLTNLSHLDLYNYDISDITPLLNLINLETLDIGANFMVIDFDTPNGNGDTIMNLIGMGCEVDYTYGDTFIGTP